MKNRRKVKFGDGSNKSARINPEMGNKSLTIKQDMILEFVKEHIKYIGYPPSRRDLADRFDISAKAIQDHINAIAKKGYIKLHPGVARGISVI